MNHESSECFDQADRWWGTALWQPAFSCRVRYAIQVSEYFFDHTRIFNAGDDFDGAATFWARFNVDVEHPFEPLCPGHGCQALRRRWIWCLFKCLNLSTLAPPGRCDQRPVLAIRCEHTRDGFAPLLLIRAFGIFGNLDQRVNGLMPTAS